MRNGFAEVALAREIGSGLKLIVGSGRCGRVVGGRFGLRWLSAGRALRSG
jgi:hypothetical protein